MVVSMTDARPAEIRLVVFDLGRVLLRIADSWDHAFALAHVTPRGSLKGDISAATRRHHDAHGNDLFTDFETGRITPEQFFEQAARATGHSPQEVQAVLEAWLLTPFAGSRELLADLHAQAIPTACLSNTNAHHWAMMTDPTHPAYLPLHLLTHPLASHTLGQAKPHDAIYHQVEQVTQTPAQHILFFDDLAENTAAAAQRGWYAHLIEPSEDPITQARRWLAHYGVLATDS